MRHFLYSFHQLIDNLILSHFYPKKRFGGLLDAKINPKLRSLGNYCHGFDFCGAAGGLMCGGGGFGVNGGSVCGDWGNCYPWWWISEFLSTHFGSWFQGQFDCLHLVHFLMLQGLHILSSYCVTTFCLDSKTKIFFFYSEPDKGTPKHVDFDKENK